jgi:energy-coupling factor transport system ATP-binding protein
VLDEPTFGQDRRTWVELIELLAGHRDDGGAICAVTHDQEVVTSLADRVLKLDGEDVAPPITPAEVST